MGHLRVNYETYLNAITLIFPFPFKMVYFKKSLQSYLIFITFIFLTKKSTLVLKKNFYWANSYEFMSKTILK